MSRSSLLSAYYQQPVTVDIPQLPGWATGGAFNQIERDILSTNSARAQLESQRQNNDLNDFRLQQAELEQQFNENLANVFSGNPTSDIRKMYELAASEAVRSGVPMQALKFQDGIQQLERQDRLDRNDLQSQMRWLWTQGMDSEASEMARALGYDPENLFNDQARSFRTMRNTFGGASDRVRLNERGEPEVIYDAPEKPVKPKVWYQLDGTIVELPNTVDGERTAREMGLVERYEDAWQVPIPGESKEQEGPGLLERLMPFKTGEPEAKKQQDLVDGLGEKYGAPMKPGDELLMSLPEPLPGESEDDFVRRVMGQRSR